MTPSPSAGAPARRRIPSSSPTARSVRSGARADLRRPSGTDDEGTARGAAIQAAAIATGRTVAEVMADWRPANTVVAEPREFPAERWERYRSAAAVTALDRATDGA